MRRRGYSVENRPLSNFISKGDKKKGDWKGFTSGRPLKAVKPGRVVKNKPEDEEDHWARRQEKAFSEWINFEFSQYNAKNSRSIDQARREALSWFHSDSIKQLKRNISNAIEREKICMKPDLNIVSDICIREYVCRHLLMYNPQWLSLALETVLDCTLAKPTICELTQCLSLNLLGKDNSEKGKRAFLKRLLLVVYFLDRCKSNQLLQVCLFIKSSQIKSSQEMLNSLMNNILGQVYSQRHFISIGYQLVYIQTPVDEYNFVVNELSHDLRDGIRLSKLVEILSDNVSILDQMRFPANSKQVMLSNMTLLFEKLLQLNCHIKLIKPIDIVEGHREKTLSILWSLIYKFKVCLQLPTDELKAEIVELKQRFKQEFGREFSENQSVYFQSQQLSLLFEWASVVCAFNDYHLQNFSNSFADGRAFCFLINFYHPLLLPVTDMHDAIDHEKSGEDGNDENLHNFNDSFVWIPMNTQSEQPKEHLLIDLYNEKVTQLGGLPLIHQVIDEKTSIITTFYLCLRLLSLKHEKKHGIENIIPFIRGFLLRQKLMRQFHAASVIQVNFRHYKERRQKSNIIVSLQSNIRGFLLRKRLQSIISLQANCKRFLFQESLKRRSLAVTLIQSSWRGYKARRDFQSQKNASLLIQKNWKGHLERTRFKRLIKSIRLLQISWRNFQIRDNKEKSALVIQKTWKGYKCKMEFNRQRESALVIQKTWKGFKNRREYKKLHCATKTIQNYWRGYKCKLEYVNIQKSAIVIQKTWKCFRQISDYQKLMQSTVVIQSHWRGLKQRSEYLMLRNCAITIQSRWKGYKTRKQVKLMIKSIAVIETSWIEYKSNQKIRLREKSAIAMQRHWRGYKAKMEYKKLKKSPIAIQRVWRGHRVRREHRQLLQATVTIQRRWRSKKNTEIIQRELIEHSALTIQSCWRGFLCRRKRSRKLKELSKRIEHVNKNVKEEDRIGNRAKFAIDLLMNSKQMSQLTKACLHLEAVTRLSKDWCLKIIDNYNAIEKLCALIQSCNKSKPHLEVLKLSFSIIRNLCKYQPIVDHLYNDKSKVFHLIVDSLHQFRDQDNILLLLFEILHSFSLSKLEEMKTNKDLEAKVISIKQIFERKVKSEISHGKIMKEADFKQYHLLKFSRVLSKNITKC